MCHIYGMKLHQSPRKYRNNHLGMFGILYAGLLTSNEAFV